jgi:phage terminase large subunit-like protein
MKENDWDEIIQEVLIITARRMGKTTVVAVFAAALLICIPNVKLMIFSVSLNSSRKMQQTIQDFCEMHPIGEPMMKRPFNKDKLWYIFCLFFYIYINCYNLIF